MAAGRFTVVDADHYDQEDGLIIGSTVTAEDGTVAGLLHVTHIGDVELREPIAVKAEQLKAVA